jgi:hypothetical protein
VTRPHELRQLAWEGVASCAAFAPDGSWVVTGTKDRKVLTWPVPTREEITHRLEAEITLVEPAQDPRTRQVRIWAEVEDPEERLIPGGLTTMVAYPK